MTLATLFAELEEGTPDMPAEVADYLRTRTKAEQVRALRVLRAVFDELDE